MNRTVNDSPLPARDAENSQETRVNNHKVQEWSPVKGSGRNLYIVGRQLKVVNP